MNIDKLATPGAAPGASPGAAPDAASRRTGVAALLAPASIAIVGASVREDSLGGRPIANLLRQGFRGTILPVNPRYTQIGALPCYPDLLSLPESPDVVLVLVGSERVFPVLDQCLQIGARTAILFAGGFAEADAAGAELQLRLKTYAAQGLRICGPNCNGVFSVAARAAMGFSPTFELPVRRGRVALLSQSGAIATGVSSRGMEMGLGFSHIVATGNEADLEVSDFVEHLLDDAGTQAFALFLEGLKNPLRFLQVAEAALARGKPMVVLKAGRSASGQRVALSHTGSMAGSYDVLVGALRQRGVAIAHELDELLGLAAIFSTHRPAQGAARGAALAIVSLSGGMAALAADHCDAASVPLAEFAPGTQAELRAALPAMATIANPLDVTGHVVNEPAVWTRCLDTLSADPGVDVVVSILSMTANQTERHFAADLVAASARPGPLQVAVWTSGAPAGSGLDLLHDAGVPTFLRCDDAVRAVAAWRHYGRTRDARLAALAQAGAAQALLAPKAAAVASPWDLLAQAGIPAPRHVLASTPAELMHALVGLRFPLAVKVQSDAIAHKSEHGLVRIGVATADDCRRAFDDMLNTVATTLAGTPIDGVLLQEMATGQRELILGVRVEPALGPAIVLGVGGIFSEVFNDIAIRLAPLTAFDAHEMIGELRARALFGAVRGLGAVQLAQFAELVVRFSQAAVQHAGLIDEMEINPLIVADDGASCVAVDVLVARTAPGAGTAANATATLAEVH